MTVLITGGAGYIGSHVVRLLTDRGERPVVVDDLSSGLPERVGPARLEQVDLSLDSATPALARLMTEEGVTAVIHFAAKKQVGESVERPAWYWRQNVGGLANVLLAMEQVGVPRLVFSSSAATYGAPDVVTVREDGPAEPINPYGETKLVGEWMSRAASRAWGLHAVNLRYFNVAGAGWPELGDRAVMNLVPIALSALTSGRQPHIYGNDFDTPDGTGIRDYVHVLDLADAHLAALSYLDADVRPFDTFNVGTGTGASVREVLNQIGRTTGLPMRPQVVARRAGDPPALVADVSRIAETLGWRAEHGLTEIIDSAWKAWQSA